jgi:hypothetical protein
MSISSPPRLIVLAVAGTSLASATRGFSGPRVSANPISSATTSG